MSKDDLDLLTDELEDDLGLDLEDKPKEEKKEPKKKEKKQKAAVPEEDVSKPNWETINIDDVKVPKIKVRDVQEAEVLDIAKSIKNDGLLNPILVDENGILIAGLRRFLAHKKLKKKSIKCITVAVPKDEQYRIALVENIQRQQLTPEQEGHAYSVLLESNKYDTQKELAQALGISESKVSLALSAIGETKEKPKKKVVADKEPPPKSTAIDQGSLVDGVTAKLFKHKVVLSFDLPFENEKHAKQFDIAKEVTSRLEKLNVKDVNKELRILRKQL